ncbi:MAG: MarR family transcriptional regulator [Acidimicrobiales bacterium]|nr:MAG: MarR family transcriptional regulator [Acidimicrobiales bacterium]
MTTTSITATWERLVRFHRTSTDTMDAHLQAEFGRTLDDYDILHQVRSHDGPIRMGDLAQRLLIANSSCHRIVGRLVDDGFLQRLTGSGDRREVHIQLTAAGKRQWRRMAVVHTRDIEDILGGPLPVSERAQLDEILQQLLEEEVD